jgi:hypothetical protein
LVIFYLLAGFFVKRFGAIADQNLKTGEQSFRRRKGFAVGQILAEKREEFTRLKDGASGNFRMQAAQPNFYNAAFDLNGFETESALTENPAGRAIRATDCEL